MFIGGTELVSINNVKKTVSKKVVFIPDYNPYLYTPCQD